MSTPVTAQGTWTRKELEGFNRRQVEQAAKRLGFKTSGTRVELIERILELQPHLLSSHQSHDSSSSQQTNLVPPPEPPKESRPNHHALSVYEDPGKRVISPQKAGSLGSNPSQGSAYNRHLSLGTNTTSPRKDKGKATEAADAEQLEDSSGEVSGSCTDILHQPASTTATSPRKAKVPPRRRKEPTKPPRGGESTPPQHQENNDSQERFQVQKIVLVSDNYDSSIESRVKKLETSVSGLQEENARVLKDNNELRMKNAKIQKENSDLKVQMSDFSVRLVMLEALLEGEAPARSLNSSPTDLEGESAPSLGLPDPKRQKLVTFVPPIGPTLENCPATASPTLIKRGEHRDQGNDHANGRESFEAQPRKTVPAIVQPSTPPPSLPPLSTPHAAISELRPPVPAIVVGFKRKFVGDNFPSDCWINPMRRAPHLPSLKRRKFGHFIHKRLGEVVAMSRQERECMKLSEAIKLASRRHMPIWHSSRPFAKNVAYPGLEHMNETEN